MCWRIQRTLGYEAFPKTSYYVPKIQELLQLEHSEVMRPVELSLSDDVIYVVAFGDDYSRFMNVY